ncbi:pyruvate dehydrogenase (acetyl-transferring) E1 component subunit alpha [Roseiflexus sp. AH-315-K22]|nr:pyruvate dehydrogenase (acetyl-transferring) E1 component subunit alpha [Roseiflexus sp. AH-315-K22]
MASTKTKPKAGTRAPRLSDDLTNETLREWLYTMQLIREFELRTAQAYQQAKIGGFCHIYIGQEASAVGTIGCVHHDDPVILAYRDHGHALARGMDPKACMAEMFGKAAGCAKGKGGSMHMFDRPNWLFGGHGIVGAQTGLGTGLAFAARYEYEVLGEALDGGKAKKKVCLCYLGDGALNQGVLHESQNLAGVLGIPVMFIVENNGYSMGTAIERGTTMADDLSRKAAAYGMEYAEIEGMDILNIYDKFKPLADECRDEQKPAFINLKTYRYQGHSMSDPQKYRTKAEVESWKDRDSIASLASRLMTETSEGGRGCLSEDEWKQMQKEIRSIVRAAVKFADDAAEPSVEEELYSDVYANPVPNLSPSRDYVHGAKNPLL